MKLWRKVPAADKAPYLVRQKGAWANLVIEVEGSYLWNIFLRSFHSLSLKKLGQEGPAYG